jgi:glycosyltransferase involved in cell wall biosynthesis
MKNKISVCLATYNGEKYIKEQIDSILIQLGENDEIIISDDGSTDNTIDIIKKYNDYRIKIYHNNNRKGVIGNFENALNYSTGEFIFLSDQDDIWLSDKIVKTLPYLKDYDLVISDCKIVDEKLNIVYESVFEKFGSKSGFLRNFYKNYYWGCCMAFNHKIKDYILPFSKKIAMHDIWIGLNVELNGSVFFLDQPLILYRRHGQNVSPTGEKSKYSLVYKIYYRIIMLYEILKRYLYIKFK